MNSFTPSPSHFFVPSRYPPISLVTLSFAYPSHLQAPPRSQPKSTNCIAQPPSLIGLPYPLPLLSCLINLAAMLVSPSELFLYVTHNLSSLSISLRSFLDPLPPLLDMYAQCSTPTSTHILLPLISLSFSLRGGGGGDMPSPLRTGSSLF